MSSPAEPEPVDLAIVGAGAAGLFCAIHAARANPDLRVVALDGAGRYEKQVALPAAGAGLGFDGSTGWSFQFLSTATAELSAPLRIDL